MDGCIFCAIAEGRAPGHRVYEDEHTVAFLDINPATDGHTLVVPRAHVADLWEIGEDLASAVMRSGVRVGAILRRALEPDGLNILQANGAAAFQTVFHFHLHLVPRYRGDRVHLPWQRTPGDRARLAEMAARITRVAAET